MENACFRKIFLHFLYALLEYRDGAQSLERPSSVSKLHAEMRRSKQCIVVNNHQQKESDAVKKNTYMWYFSLFPFYAFIQNAVNNTNK